MTRLPVEVSNIAPPKSRPRPKTKDPRRPLTKSNIEAISERLQEIEDSEYGIAEVDEAIAGWNGEGFDESVSVKALNMLLRYFRPYYRKERRITMAYNRIIDIMQVRRGDWSINTAQEVYNPGEVKIKWNKEVRKFELAN